MPFIGAKVTVSVDKQKEEKLKKRLGEAISTIPGKSENWLMVGIEDNYKLYFRGNQDGESAFVEVKIFGSSTDDVYEKLTAVICEILEDELGIAKDRTYIKYEEIQHWGWNGTNF